MKIRQIVLALLVVISLISSAQAKDGPRIKEKFNENWRFCLSDSVVFSELTFDDSNWRLLDLPHDWSVESDCSKDYSGRNAWLPGGLAWYRKSFELPKTDEGKHIEIQFDGVYRHSKIWVNGVFIGVQYDGYTSFYFDITEALKFGERNTIAVRVDNSVQPNCRWYSGSGIYRNVWLTKTSPLHVANWGTYIATPLIDEDKAEVAIQTTIENTANKKDFTLETIILDENGTEVGRAESSLTAMHQRQFEVQQKVNLLSPQLWSLKNPVLYSAFSMVKVDGKVVDNYKSTFGIRTLDFDADKGFFLNGESLKMKGVCLHHEAGPFGAAVPECVWERRLKKLKELGCNAIRTSHNPPAPEFLEMCDRLGFLVMDEFVDKWDNISMENAFYDTPFADPYFHTEWKKNFQETIRRDRNHPSIVIWSVGNENHPSGDERQNLSLKRYCSFVRSLDPTRPVISGMERGKDKAVDEKIKDIIESCSYMDLIALNYGEQWCRLINEQKPGKPYVSTESYTYFNSSQEKRWANIERAPWLDVIENDQNMGLFLWVGINYLGESRRWPGLGSTSGLLDMAGFRTSRSYLWEAFWSEKPMVAIEVYDGDADDFSTSGRWGAPPMSQNWNLPKDSLVDIVTYTNCEEVELFMNDKELGTQKLADFPNWIMKWRNLAHKPGTLRAVGKIGGKPVCESVVKTTGSPATIKLLPDVESVSTDGIVQVEVALTDKRGNQITHNDQQIHFNLEGDGEILVLANGKMTTLEKLQERESKSTYNGNLLCVLRTGKIAGTIKLVARGEGLRSQTIEIEVKK